MLDSLRAFATTWVAKVFLGLLIIGLAGFGISNVFLNTSASTIARVGGQEISALDFRRDFQEQLGVIANQTGQSLTTEQAIAQGVPGGVLAGLAAEATLNELADRYGVGVADSRIARSIQNDPAFAGTVGTFERDRFRQVVASSGFTEEGFLTDRADTLRRQQVAQALFGGLKAPKAAERLTRRFQGDTRTISYFTVDDSSIDEITPPDDTTLATYLDENALSYLTLENRTARVMILSPEILARTIDVSDEEVATEYDRIGATLNVPETRTIELLSLPADVVGPFEQAMVGGEPLDSLAREFGIFENYSSLGTLSQAEVIDELVGQTAFSMAVGDITTIDLAAGKVAVRVSAISPGGAQTLEQASELIRNQLTLAAARNKAVEVLDQIEELRAGATKVDVIARQFSLPMTEFTVDTTGRAIEQVTDLPQIAYLPTLQAIFGSSVSGLTPSVPISATTTVWFDLLSIEPARPRTLDEAREDLTTAWIAEKAAAARQGRADELMALIRDGLSVADAAGRDGQVAQPSTPFTRQGNALIPNSVAAAAFAGPVGYKGMGATPDGNLMLFEVTEVVPAPEGDNEQNLNTAVDAALLQTVYAQFIVANQNDMGFRTNNQAIQQMLSTLTAFGGGAGHVETPGEHDG
jgi:peptidyl-prolyl cis-trans isomerase D